MAHSPPTAELGLLQSIASVEGDGPSSLHSLIARGVLDEDLNEVGRLDQQAGQLFALQAQPPPSGVFDIYVEPDLLPGISSALDVYTADLRSESYDVTIHPFSGTASELRAELQEQWTDAGLEGALFVGDLPHLDFTASDGFSAGASTVTYPHDLYFMDLDGNYTFSDQGPDSHTGDAGPEIYVSRLTAGNLGGISGKDETTLVNDYFAKVHAVRTGEIGYEDRAIWFADDDWGPDFGALERQYTDVTYISGPTDTTFDRYVQALGENAETLVEMIHSWPQGHSIIGGGSIGSADIAALNPNFGFLNMFNCSAADFTAPDNLIGAYVLTSDHVVNAIGSTKAGGMFDFADFYGPQGAGSSMGQAFLQWFDANAVTTDEIDQAWKIDWFYGMTMQGDPTLRPASITGGKFLDEVLTGTPGNDTLDGRGGNDVISGAAGDDLLIGGSGDDRLDGGNDADRLDGGPGKDSLNGGTDSDVFVFGPGYGNDTIELLEDGIDRIDVSAFGFGSLDELQERTTVTVGTSDSGTPFLTIDFHDGDVLTINGIGRLTAENLVLVPGAFQIGTSGDDVLLGTHAEDIIEGREGRDTLLGDHGNDSLHGGDQGDSLPGDLGDLLDGGPGEDLLNGGAGPDVFVFKPGYGQDHVFWLEDGIDKLYISGFGFSSLDELLDGTTVTAGTRESGASFLTIDFHNGDILTIDGVDRLTANNVVLAAGPLQVGTVHDDLLFGTDAQDDIIEGREGNDSLWGGSGNDALHGGDQGDFLAGDGNDALEGGPGDDLLNGGAGADIFVYGPGDGRDQLVWFEDGIDLLELSRFGVASLDELAHRATISSGTLPSGASVVTLDFGVGDVLTVPGIDRLDEHDVRLAGGSAAIVGTSGNDSIVGPIGDNILDGREGDDRLFGQDGRDTLFGGAGRDDLFGGTENDFLHGGNQYDFLEGDAGDVLDGGPGNDLLNGGFGPDMYVFGPGYGEDRIFWFEDGIDTFHLFGDYRATTAAEVAQLATISTGTVPGGASFVSLDFRNGDVLTLVGIDHIDDFDVLG